MTQETTVAINAEPQSSVELTVSAKGVVQPTVKIYHHDPDVAYRLACNLFDELRRRYADGQQP